MPRKKISYDSEEIFRKPDPKPAKFVERDGRMITNEKIFKEDDKSSPVVGVAMANEIVKILDQSVSPDHMTKIRTYVTNREGYVNPKSLY